MAEPPVSAPWSLGIALTRVALIVVGATALAHRLVREMAPADRGGSLEAYGPWLADALTPNSDVVQALGSTMMLAAVATAMGLAFAAVSICLVRFRIGSRLLGILATPTLGLALPGLALFPLLWWAGDRGIIPDRPVTLDTSVADGARFLAAWGAAVGLAIAPSMAALLIDDRRGGRAATTFGLAPATALLAARPSIDRRLAFPTTSMVLALATAEILSGYDGLFGRFADRLTGGDAIAALDLVPVIAVGGAVLALAIDLVPLLLDDLAPHDDPAPTTVAESTWPLLAALGSATLIATVGYLLIEVDPVDPAASAQVPTFGGPWLGTDDSGRSLVELVTVALGPTIVAGVTAALPAVMIGVVLAALGRYLPTVLRRLYGALLDVAWWPLVLLVPLAVVADGSVEGSEARPIVVAVTAAGLIPIATRLADRALATDGERLRWLTAGGLVVASLAVAARIVTGMMGVTTSSRGPGTADLGALAATGIATYGDNPWTLVLPAVVGAALLAVGLALAAAIVDRVPVAAISPIPAEVPTPIESMATDTIELASGPAAEGRAARQGPRGPRDLRSVVRSPAAVAAEAAQIEAAAATDGVAAVDGAGDGAPDDEPAEMAPPLEAAEPDRGEPPTDDSPVDGAEDAPGDPAGEESEPGVTGAGPDQPIDGGEPPLEVPDETVDAEPDAVIDLTEAERPSEDVEAPLGLDPADDGPTVPDDTGGPPDTGLDDDAARAGTDEVLDGDDEDTARDEDTTQDEDGDDDPDIAAEATKTIELRPSTLRRAGIVADDEPEPPVVLADRPILATGTEDYGEELVESPEEPAG
ncbi:MAG: hypothetical protein AAF547_12565 [Actinomycetota bacterium]